MLNVKVTAARGRDNVTRLVLTDTSGDAFDLDAKGATRVTVDVASELRSASAEVAAWSANTVDIVFGGLSLPPGEYLPKVMYFSAQKPNGEVVVGPGFRTQITLTVVA